MMLFNGIGMTYLVAFVLFGLVSARHLHEKDPAENEIFYHVGRMITFKCDDRPHTNSSVAVRWNINGLLIKRQHLKHIPAWQVNNNNLHGNDLKVTPRPSYLTTSTLYCMIKGKYKWNVKKVFNLVKDIDRRPGGSVLQRHPMKQTCLLYSDKVLTLTCRDAVKYENIIKWQWRRNGQHIIGHDSPQLVVEEGGNYVCSYYQHKGSAKDLLRFKVRKASGDSSSTGFLGDWAFFKYTDRQLDHN